MAERNYPSNSHRARESMASERQKKASVVKVDGTTKKRSGISKVTDNFFAEDVSSVGSYILTKVIIPKTMDLLSSIVKQGIDVLLYGETGTTSSNTNRISYNKYYKDRGSENRSAIIRNRPGLDYEEPILQSFDDACAVLESMYDCADEAGVVSILDMYEFAGIPSDNYMLNHYGWTRLSLRNAKVERMRDGYYILKMPKAMQID
jgi:hypothetical protein